MMPKPPFAADLMLLAVVALVFVTVRVQLIAWTPTAPAPAAALATISSPGGWAMRAAPDWAPSPPRPLVRRSSERLSTSDRPAIRWTGDVRRDLQQIATARWYRPLVTWNDTSGYGSVEAIRAAHGTRIEPSASSVAKTAARDRD